MDVHGVMDIPQMADNVNQSLILALRETAVLWKKELFRLKNLKKHQFGGPLVIETPYFAPLMCDCFSLCVLGVQPFQNFFIPRPYLQSFNFLFGMEWSYLSHGIDGKETWEVDSIQAQYIKGALTLTFMCIVRNEKGDILSIR